jgi:hypothetical protein
MFVCTHLRNTFDAYLCVCVREREREIERERERDLVDEVIRRSEASPASTNDNHLLSLRGFIGRGKLGPGKAAATATIDGRRSREASRTGTAGI